MTKNKSVYIPSVEGCDIWAHNYRNKNISMSYRGMVPESLLLRKLKEFPEFEYKKVGKKLISNDIINLKFENIVKSGTVILNNIPEFEDLEEAIKKIKMDISKAKKYELDKLNRKLDRAKKSLIYYTNLKTELTTNGDDDMWKEVSTSELRNILYTEGFSVDHYDKKTESVTTIKYRYFGRSASKSRKGQCWFIKESLLEDIISWMRMGLDFNKEGLDLSGLLSYETLVGSTIVDTVNIESSSILMVDKVVSKFEKMANVIEMNDEGELISSPRIHKFENEIFDGEALLDESLFQGKQEGKGFVLLRHLFFKAACFNTKIQDFLIQYASENNIEFDKWYIKDMFGSPIKASAIRMITNPSCLKIFKFDYTLGSKKAVYDHWRNAVDLNNAYGICKHEKKSLRGRTEDNRPLQRMSYQMVNSLPANKQQVEELSKIELDYIMKLKNNPKFFIEHLENNKTNTNANSMFVALYGINKNITEMKIFRDFKKHTIKKYREHLQSGHIRLEGDYTVMGGNLVEYLMKSVGEIGDEINEPLAFTGSDIYTPLFAPGELTGFRNPHVSPANILSCENVKLDENNRYHNYIKYFNLTDNIVIVNGIGFELNDILSGCDFDSDTILLCKSKILQSILKPEENYLVPVNNIPLDTESDEMVYHLTIEDMCRLDSKAAKSKTQIGSIVNTSQLAMSLYYDEKSKENPNQAIIEDLLEKISITSVLSGLSIDSVKRKYKVDPSKEINKIKKQIELKKKMVEVEIKVNETVEVVEEEVVTKPNFWKYVHNEKFTKNNEEFVLYREHHECPMDFLFDVMSNLPPAKPTIKPKKLKDMLVAGNHRDGNRKHIKLLEQLSNESQSAISSANMSIGDEDELNTEVDNIVENYNERFSKLKINDKTVYAVLVKIHNETEGTKEAKSEKESNSSWLRLMNHLYNAHTELFLNSFKQAN